RGHGEQDRCEGQEVTLVSGVRRSPTRRRERVRTRSEPDGDGRDGNERGERPKEPGAAGIRQEHGREAHGQGGPGSTAERKEDREREDDDRRPRESPAEPRAGGALVRDGLDLPDSI